MFLISDDRIEKGQIMSKGLTRISFGQHDPKENMVILVYYTDQPGFIYGPFMRQDKHKAARRVIPSSYTIVRGTKGVDDIYTEEGKKVGEFQFAPLNDIPDA